jgi:hypothetical protein
MDTLVGQPTLAQTSGVQTIGAANPCVLYGLLVGSVGTSQAISLWTQTATVTGIPVVASLVGAANTYYQVNGYFKKGITYSIPMDSPSVTFFWNPYPTS